MTQLETWLTLSIRTPSQEERSHRIDAPLSNPTNQEIHDLYDLFKVWVEDLYPTFDSADTINRIKGNVDRHLKVGGDDAA